MEKEIEIKQSGVKNFLEENNFEGIILSRQSNFLWFSGGRRNDVIKNEDVSLVYLFITKDKRYLIATNSDADRVMKEELEGYGFELVKFSWFNQNVFDAIKKIGIKGKIAADFYEPGLYFAEGDLAYIRKNMTSFEVERYKKFCSDYAKTITNYCLGLRKKLTEIELAAGLNYECYKRGIRMPVLMIGSDERIFSFKHPCSTNKKIDKYVLIATVGEREGICANVTRCVYFGKIPAELMERHHAVNYVINKFYANAIPGKTTKELFEIGKEAYKEVGYDGEWESHIQGGISGYKPLEFEVNAVTDIKISNNNIMAFNPTIKGTKSEDPILTKNNSSEITVFDKRWPFEEIEVDGKKFKRPLIMEL
ncbi:MAG: aminopeptidase P family protein [Actinobacteria bacterium]|nr:aminopeptidase P family protein [Actinomycetota bacterium]